MCCPDCNKFVSLELQDPEVSDLEITHRRPPTAGEPHTFTITGTVRIVRTCAECGQELKEATLDIEHVMEVAEFDMTVEARALVAKMDDATIEETGVEQVEEGGGRYAKSYFGAIVQFDIEVEGVKVCEGEWTDKVAASLMDEMV